MTYLRNKCSLGQSASWYVGSGRIKTLSRVAPSEEHAQECDGKEKGNLVYVESSQVVAWAPGSHFPDLLSAQRHLREPELLGSSNTCFYFFRYFRKKPASLCTGLHNSIPGSFYFIYFIIQHIYEGRCGTHWIVFHP